MNADADLLEQIGRIWFRGLLQPSDLALLDAACDAQSTSQRLVYSADVAKVIGSTGPIAKALAPFYPNAFPTRVVSFTKTENNNWSVPWHQDRVIAVKERQDVEDFKNWSRKQGTWHCEPPNEILENMLFLRIHLDNDVEDNGAMEIAHKSHELGRIEGTEAEAIADQHEVEVCKGRRGDVLVLKMLTLHRSLPTQSTVSRRVLRVDYAHSALPSPLFWNDWAEAH